MKLLRPFRVLGLHLFLEMDEEQAKGTHLYAVCDRSGKTTRGAVFSDSLSFVPGTAEAPAWTRRPFPVTAEFECVVK